MNLWHAFKSALTVDPVYRKAAPITTEYFGPVGQRAADWSLVSTGERVRDAWLKCATAFACMTLLADAVAESPLRVYRQNEDGEPEEDPKHRARALIANPNPFMSEAEFMSLTVLTMGLHGYACTEKVRSGANIPVELWPRRPDWLKREYVGNTVQWVYRQPGRDPYVIADENLLITPYYHDPNQVALGISPLHIIGREVGVDVSLTDLLKVFIDNGGIPPWALEIPEGVNDNDPGLQARIDTLREKWRQKYGGTRAYSELAILYGGMKLHKLGDSIGDMAWPDLRGLTEMKICQAFRVPADLVQARDSMNSGSLTTTEMDGSMAFLQNHGAQPLRTRIDGAFTRGLLADFTGGDSTYSLEFDTSGILALQEDEDARHNRVRADWQAGLITLNEARRETDRADLGSDGDVFMQTFTTMLVSASELVSAPDPQPAPVRSGTVIRALTEGKAQRVYRDLKALSPGELEVRASGLRSIQRDKQRLEEIGTRQLRKFFRDQGRRVVAAMPKSGPIASVKADHIDWQDEEDALRDLLMRFYGASGERAFANVSATVGVELAWDLANRNIARVLDDLGQRIVGISETTRQDVVKVITDGQAEGLTLQQISDNMTGMFEESYRGRSMTIARTETMLSYSKASVLGYQESGVVEQIEISDNPEHDTDPGSDGLTCAERHGLVVNLGDADRHIEAEHPNGSLACIPILAKPLGEV